MRKTFIVISALLFIAILINIIGIVSGVEVLGDGSIVLSLLLFFTMPEVAFGALALFGVFIPGVVFYAQKKGWAIIKIAALSFYGVIASLILFFGVSNLVKETDFDRVVQHYGSEENLAEESKIKLENHLKKKRIVEEFEVSKGTVEFANTNFFVDSLNSTARISHTVNVKLKNKTGEIVTGTVEIDFKVEGFFNQEKQKLEGVLIVREQVIFYLKDKYNNNIDPEEYTWIYDALF